MTKRMLIDTTHAEETRVVVLNGNRLDEFDFETSTKKQVKGNIYLAKVTRVEPSLQAAFVDYGGNRHGFLAFSEIHPDYYQIPIADRQALLKEEAEFAAASAEETEEAISGSKDEDATDKDDKTDQEDGAETAEGDADNDAPKNEKAPDGANLEEVGGGDENDVEAEAVERNRSRPRRQRYNIQEVIKRRQILLIQVVKEERGNKGAALTTYLSLAGRYCVLMPNTTKGGGISRKITNIKDRKRLKGFIADFNIPDGVAAILRTAAIERSKPEIRRDFDYLIRTWDQVRELTLKSIAPTMVYEEGNLIKRSIRDLYDKDITEVMVEGEEGYKSAKEFMRMLMPSHAKKVQQYKDPAIPLYHRYQVEAQLDSMHSTNVRLKSGGYIVINPTEALVSIDVNSGRATKERNIEETAYKTNLEAAEEIARQLKLRDLAGLIVIDFIDMSENRNQHTVERRLKESMRADRARIQIGRISPFGLLELSRQRLRPSLLEASTEHCPHCDGSGLIRSTESAALHVLRTVEEEGIRRRSSQIHISVPTAIALYILNQKRPMVADIEARYDFRIMVSGDDTLIAPNFKLERVVSAGDNTDATITETIATSSNGGNSNSSSGANGANGANGAAKTEDRPKRARRPRRRRGGRNDEDTNQRNADQGTASETTQPPVSGEPNTQDQSTPTTATPTTDGDETQSEKPKRRRRGRRGGRRHNRKPTEQTGVDGETTNDAAQSAETSPVSTDAPSTSTPAPTPETSQPAPEASSTEASADASGGTPSEAATPAEKPKPRPRRSRAKAKPEEASADASPDASSEPAEKPAPKKRAPRKRATKAADKSADKATDADAKSTKAEAKPAKKTTRKPRAKKADKAQPTEAATEPTTVSAEPSTDAAPEAPDAPKRRGWWSRG
ncbi:MAG: Rne/Rng family ribonuclease [Rhodospirillales bacterium]|jgi:ribonuclease E|nr:Rne/Rng family ribonuclease [Rhodospirillales bacterium]MBT4006197.1 Rne/Rng family ribonuclease [Rhodospirillales bacterium]MBT5114378.1 Rne/Rng family ribonuclease [Rhodospirillales bacterium]MBT5672770.1 Rne/Rng family ribonuclease [Rhodospirillales bacterium]MBT6186995.1 Rne/Rng family ribonuclease [Rhodospirillales bacterium]